MSCGDLKQIGLNKNNFTSLISSQFKTQTCLDGHHVLIHEQMFKDLDIKSMLIFDHKNVLEYDKAYHILVYENQNYADYLKVKQLVTSEYSEDVDKLQIISLGNFNQKQKNNQTQPISKSISSELTNMQIKQINKEAEEQFRSNSIFYSYIQDKDSIDYNFGAMFDIISLRIRSMHKNNKIMDLRKLPSFNNVQAVKLHKLVPNMIRQIYFPGNNQNSIGSGSFVGSEYKMQSDLSRDESFDHMYDTKSHTDMSRDDSTTSFGISGNENINQNSQKDSSNIGGNQFESINNENSILNGNLINNISQDNELGLNLNQVGDYNTRSRQTSSPNQKNTNNNSNSNTNKTKSKYYSEIDSSQFYSCDRGSNQNQKSFTDSPVQTLPVSITDLQSSGDNTVAYEKYDQLMQHNKIKPNQNNIEIEKDNGVEEGSLDKLYVKYESGVNKFNGFKNLKNELHVHIDNDSMHDPKLNDDQNNDHDIINTGNNLQINPNNSRQNLQLEQLNQSKDSDLNKSSNIQNFNSFGFEENEQIDKELRKEKLYNEDSINHTNNSNCKTTDINESNKSSMLKMSDISTNNKSDSIIRNTNLINNQHINQQSNKYDIKKEIILNYDQKNQLVVLINDDHGNYIFNSDCSKSNFELFQQEIKLTYEELNQNTNHLIIQKAKLFIIQQLAEDLIEFVHEILQNIRILDIITHNYENQIILESTSKLIKNIQNDQFKYNWISVRNLPFIDDHQIQQNQFIELFINEEKFVPLFNKIRVELNDDKLLSVKYRFKTPNIIKSSDIQDEKLNCLNNSSQVDDDFLKNKSNSINLLENAPQDFIDVLRINTNQNEEDSTINKPNQNQINRKLSELSTSNTKEKNVSFDPSIDKKSKIPILSNLNNLDSLNLNNQHPKKISVNSATNQYSHRSNLLSHRSDMSLDVNQPNMVANQVKKIRSTLDIQRNSAKHINAETKKSLNQLLNELNTRQMTNGKEFNHYNDHLDSHNDKYATKDLNSNPTLANRFSFNHDYRNKDIQENESNNSLTSDVLINNNNNKFDEITISDKLPFNIKKTSSNSNLDTVQCLFKINDIKIQCDMYPQDSSLDIASRIMAIYPGVNLEFKISLNSLAVKIYKVQNETSNSKFDAKSLISSKYLEKRMIDIKTQTQMKRDGTQLVVAISSNISAKGIQNYSSGDIKEDIPLRSRKTLTDHNSVIKVNCNDEDKIKKGNKLFSYVDQRERKQKSHRSITPDVGLQYRPLKNKQSYVRPKINSNINDSPIKFMRISHLDHVGTELKVSKSEPSFLHSVNKSLNNLSNNIVQSQNNVKPAVNFKSETKIKKSPASIGNMSTIIEDRKVLFSIKIKLYDNKFGQLTVHEGDSLANIARDFAKNHNLDKLNTLNVEKILNDTYVHIRKENLIKKKF